MEGKKIFVAIGILLLLHMAAGAILPLPDPSEARYATIARQMAESGNYIMPQIWLNGKLIPFMSKPPFAFWLMAGSIKLFGANEFAVRLPAFIAYLLLLTVIFYVIRRYHNRELAVGSILIAATTAGLYLMSGVTLVDTWLCLFAIGAIFFYFAFVSEKSRHRQKIYSRIIFIMLGLGFLTKGPVVLIFFGLPIFFWTLLNRRWATLQYHSWIIGTLSFLLITVPYFWLAEKSTPGFLKYFFLDENFYRFISPDKSHDLYSHISHHLPPGTAILFSLIVCLPWVLIQLFYYIKVQGSYEAIVADIKGSWRLCRKNLGKKNSGFFDIFLTGLIVLTLFWSLSAHLMLYYMTLITPLFAVWCTKSLCRYHLPQLRIAQFALIILLSYSIAYIPAYFFINTKKSTRYIVNRARKLRKTRKSNGKLIFVRRMSYSGYFYGGKLVIPHGKEPGEKSLQRHSGDGADIYLIRRHDLKKISAAVMNAYHCLYKDSHWTLWTDKSPAEKAKR